MTTEPSPAVPLRWLVRLRWCFLAGLLVVVGIAVAGYSRILAWLPLATVLVAYAGSNVLLWRTAHRPVTAAPARVMGMVLVLDTVLLTVFLAASGGASNPFSVLYLVHITLSAVVLSAAWTAAIAVLAVAGFASLFVLTPAAPMHHSTFGSHLQGMWTAFVLATVLTAVFVSWLSRWLAAQREQIARLREVSARNARLAALTTLAAGAAHELNTPLGTIAVAAHEAARHSEALPGAASVVDDLRLIEAEVDRCQEILHRMAAHAADRDHAGKLVTVPELVALISDHLGEHESQRVDVRGDDAAPGIALPSLQVAQSVVALIRNALDASSADDTVVVQVSGADGEVHIEVADRGPGIPETILDKVGEPFFTTKDPGKGLGLGVYLARSVVESRGGTLCIESTPGEGTRATVRLPGTEPAGSNA